MSVSRMLCGDCGASLEAEFEISPLARLALSDQLFVLAFLREHGSIKKMERHFGISYPTVKNRLNAIVRQLNQEFEAPSPESTVLEALERGEISVEEALERLE
jgi:hypothetical protein